MSSNDRRAATRWGSPAGRRRFLGAITATAAGLAGCQGASDGDVDENDGTSPATTERPTAEATVTGERTTSAGIEGGDEWVTFQNDFQRTGYDPDGSAPSGPVTEQWRTVLPDGGGNLSQDGQPVLAAGTLFTASAHRTDDAIRLYALDAVTGDLVWQTTVPTPTGTSRKTTFAAPTYHDGTVYFYPQYSQLISVDADDGTVHWTSIVEPSYRNQTNSPIVYSGQVYVTPGEPDQYETAGIKAVDPATGSVSWSYSDAPGAFGDPDDDEQEDGDASHFETMALGDDTLYATGPSSLYAVPPGANDESWEIPDRKDDPRWGTFGGRPVAFADGTVYTKGPRSFSAVEQGGDLKWNTEDGQRPNQAGYVAQVGCAVANGAVYYTTEASTEPNLHALDRSNGSVLWSATAEGDGRRFKNSPVLAGDGESVFVSTDAGKIAAFDASSGEREWEYVPDGTAASVHPIVANGAIYVDYYDRDADEAVVVALA